jgi:DNA-binding transcriptional MerR regulator
MTGSDPDRARGVYGITVAAELVGTGVQNLRAYEARGLLEPARTEGGTRRYSANDLDRLRRIGDLLAAGLNLTGIAMVLDLQDENSQLRAQKRPEGGTLVADKRIDHNRNDSVGQIPEADLLEQQTPIDPALNEGTPARPARGSYRPCR